MTSSRIFAADFVGADLSLRRPVASGSLDSVDDELASPSWMLPESLKFVSTCY